MARTKGTWGTVREVPRKGSGRYQASHVHGGVWGIQKGVRFTAPQTFESKGDAWAWIDRERRLIEKDEWTPPYERILAQQEERARAGYHWTSALLPALSLWGKCYRYQEHRHAHYRDRAAHRDVKVEGRSYPRDA